MILVLLFSIFILFLTFLYLKFKRNYNFWYDRNIRYIIPKFPTGNLAETLTTKRHFAYIIQDLYTKLKINDFDGYAGIFAFIQPMLLVLSPEFAKQVLVKDFQYFVDRGVYSNEKDDPLSANLFFIEGQKWKTLRAKITPTFTSGKLKMVTKTIFGIVNELVAYLDSTAKLKQNIEIRDILARFTTDIIGSCAFGFECKSIENPDSIFRQMGKKLFFFSKINALKMFFGLMFRRTAQFFGFRMVEKNIASFFMKIIHETIDYREKSSVKRNDFMQLMIQLKNNGVLDDDEDDEINGDKKLNEDKLTFNEIAAQAYIFFVAGFETSSTTMTFALHELAHNIKIQDCVREEIFRVLEKYNGEFTYDGINEMYYLERVMLETLRLYPPVATLHRIATKDYQLSNSSIIPKGTNIVIPTIGFHREPEFFPDPLIFDPDRFNEENKSKRHNFAYLPFGEGPRVCIGQRFGILQTKIGIAMLLKNYKFNICDKTSYPLVIDTVALLHTPKDDVWLCISKVNDI